jgi:hypothetical protein
MSEQLLSAPQHLPQGPALLGGLDLLEKETIQHPKKLQSTTDQ